MGQIYQLNFFPALPGIGGQSAAEPQEFIVRMCAQQQHIRFVDRFPYLDPLRQFAFTDHAPEKTPVDLRPRIRMPYSQKDEYLASVRSLRERYADRLRILSGFEIEYSPGREEELFELKRESDLLILGQHYVLLEGEPYYFRKTTCRDGGIVRKLADYVERAIGLGLPDIIAHPDHYLLHRTAEFTEADAETAHRICRAAAVTIV